MGTLSLQSDQVLPQGYLKIDGVTAATLTTAGISGVLYKPATATNGQVLTYNGSTWVAGAALNTWGIMGMFNKGIQSFKTPGTYSFTAPLNVTSVLVVVVGGGSTGHGSSTGYSGGTSSCSIGGKIVTATGGSPAIVTTVNSGQVNGSGGSVAEVLPDPSVGFSGVGAGIGGQGGPMNYGTGSFGGTPSGDYGQKGSSYGGVGGSTGSGGGGSRGGAAGPGIVTNYTSTGWSSSSSNARGAESGLNSSSVPFTPAFESYLQAVKQLSSAAGQGGGSGMSSTQRIPAGGGGGGCAAYVINVIPNTQYTNAITVGAGGAGVDFRGGSYPLASQGENGIVVVFY